MSTRKTIPTTVPATVLVCTLLLALSAAFVPAEAGPNQGGVILLHLAPPDIAYTTANRSYCDEFDVEHFDDINVRGEPDPTRAQIFYILAAFDPSESPRVKSVGFGIEEMDEERILIENWGSCITGETMEMPTANWPGPGSGTAVFFADTVLTQTIMPFFWFSVYVYGEAKIQLGKYPGNKFGAFFVDDTYPPAEDRIGGFGILGFGEPGVKVGPRREGEEPEIQVTLPDEAGSGQ